MRFRTPHLCCVAASIFSLTAQASAEGNPLLPFWGQPYPYGYVRPQGAIASAEPRCRRRGFDDAIRPAHHHGWPHCKVVLHVRD